jgi:hypothetical protein
LIWSSPAAAIDVAISGTQTEVHAAVVSRLQAAAGMPLSRGIAVLRRIVVVPDQLIAWS